MKEIGMGKVRIRIVLVLAFIVFVAIGSYIYISSGEWNISIKKPVKYNENSLIQEALKNLKKGGKKANIIENVKTSDKIFAINFKGLSDQATNEKILELISKSDIKTTFFISGIDAIENSKFIEKLNSTRVYIGSNGLSGAKHMEKYSNEELAKDLIRSNNIIEKSTKRQVKSLTLNSTIYTDDLLRLAHGSGYENIIHSTHILNYQSFKNYEQALGYIESREKGAIITIKMDGVLDKMEYEAPIRKEDFGVDTKENKDKGNAENMTEKILTENERLLNVVEWTLKAIEETDYKIDYAENLNRYAQEDSKIQIAELDVEKHKKSYINYKKNKKKKDTKPISNISNGNASNSDTTNELKVRKQKLEILRKNNNGRKAEEIRTVYTTEKAINFSFYGISNEKVLENTLNKLDELNLKATFFVNEKEILNNKTQIRNLSKNGHEIGIALSESMGTKYYKVLEKVLEMQKNLENITGKNSDLFRYPYEIQIADDVLEAISTVKGKIIWGDLSVASSKVGKEANLESVINNIFNYGNIFPRRGYIIYSRMDFYSDPNLIAEVVDNIVKNRINALTYLGDKEKTSRYLIKTLNDIIKGDKVYNYPLKAEDIIPSVKNKIYLGHLDGLSKEERFDILKEKYIGNPDIINQNTLPGFTDKELEEIDTVGVMTDDKVLFLTFDDWSSDKPINHILHVLDKYDVKGSFFIRTNYVQNNPNILRAIAEEGHDIGSHTDEHLPFALTKKEEDEDDSKAIYYSITDKDAEDRKRDLILSYNKLQSIVGDISIDGKPVLNRILRPPTLAMSKIGMEAIFDTGFSHIISGDFSTGDYNETDPQVIADKILNGMIKGNGEIREIQNGSILVMHMSDGDKDILNTVNVTAKSLDIAIPILKSRGYKFAKLSDYI